MATAKKNVVQEAEALFEKHAAPEPAEKPTSDYRALLAQRAELDEKIAAVRNEEVANVLAQIRRLVDEYDLHEEVQFAQTHLNRGPSVPQIAGNSRGRVAPKYRDPESGATWSGRGKPPSWIAGKDRTKFLIVR